MRRRESPVTYPRAVDDAVDCAAHRMDSLQLELDELIEVEDAEAKPAAPPKAPAAPLPPAPAPSTVAKGTGEVELASLAELEARLDRCLAGLQMHFQPIVYPDRGRFGYEALLRS